MSHCRHKQIASQLNLDAESLEWYLESSLKQIKPEIKFFGKHSSTLIPIMENKDTGTIHLLLGENWLLTLHSSKVNLSRYIDILLKNRWATSGHVYILYYNLIEQFIANNEELLVPIEDSLEKIHVSNHDKRSEVLLAIHGLSRQVSFNTHKMQTNHLQYLNTLLFFLQVHPDLT